MTGEDEEKMKKMRVRIERDAYSVLLSFKDGASPKQVERRMEETLGYTYHSKYYLAGVYDMSQILREHHQVRTTADGKFKIIANEDNQDLVALIAKQKENKRKKGGSNRGKRPMTAMGHLHRGSYSGGLVLRASPKGPAGMRPSTSMAKPSIQRPFSTVSNMSRSFTSTPGFSKATGFSKTSSTAQKPNFGNASYNYLASMKSSTPAPTVQRPLTRPSVVSSISTNSVSQMSSISTIRTSSPPTPAEHTGHMPSIKEFTDNSKRMMLILHPKSVHLSEMTERYSLEYNVTVEPLQLFSKSWMMLVKTTFKECFQINDGEVSLKQDWFQKYGAALKKTLVSKPIPVPVVSKPSLPVKQTQHSTLTSLPSNQGFRYQLPVQSKSPLELVNGRFKELHLSLPTPEKPPGIALKSSAKQSHPMMMEIFSNSTAVSRTQAKPLPSRLEVDHNVILSDPNYDSRQLRNLKLVEKSNKVKDNVDAALNGREVPELKKFTKRYVKPTMKNMQQSLQVTVSNSSHVAPVSKTTTEAASIEPPLVPSTPQRSRTRSIPDSAMSSRIFARALTEIHKQNDMESSRSAQTEQKQIYLASDHPTPTQSQKEMAASTSNEADSDDGWAISNQPEMKIQSTVSSVNGRKLLLPPMSKGCNAHTKPRLPSRPVSVTRSISSLDTMNATLERAMNATLSDDDQW